MRTSLLMILLLMPVHAAAQGFAGLGSEAEAYDQVRPNVPLVFPQDHGAHPGYRIEWWYLTANLFDADGVEYGVQFTLFRQAASPPPQREGWESQQFWLGHAALTTAETHLYVEKTARGGTGQAGATTDPFGVWVDDWQLAGAGPDLSDLRLKAGDDRFAYDLMLKTDKDIVLQGDAGYSVKSDRGQASYYYSQPHFQASGTVTVAGRQIAVSGRAWMDREWSSQPLAPDQSGWDWFSLHLDETTKVMLFRLRQDDGGDYISGNWIEDGQSTRLDPDQITLEALGRDQAAGREVPTRWRVQVPSRGVDLTTAPLNPEAWNGTGIGYWEGPITAIGSHDAIGYLELTGY